MAGKITIVVGNIGGEQTFLKLVQLAKTGMVLVEPEIHLNPLKQIEVAKKIVMLCKEKNVNFVVATNSDIFCTAILRKSVPEKLLETITVYEILKEHNKLRWHKKSRMKSGKHGNIYSEGECDIKTFSEAISKVTWIGAI